MIDRTQLERMYIDEKKSMQEIASELDCSVNRVVYWMNRHAIRRRSISEAVYQRHNPTGDPFTVIPVATIDDARLYGYGMGLYWGEGNKANEYAVRLGNTDPELIKTFVLFLEKCFAIDKSRLKYGLQLFSDCDPSEALLYWKSQLCAQDSQFYKVTVTMSRSIGTYRKKNRYGVLTVYYHNKKLRNILVDALPR